MDLKTFKLHAPFEPTGDQPTAISQMVDNINSGIKNQVLLGVTGSGKTFSIANVIEKTQKPTLVLAHNKTLAAQLFAELREFFPENSVQYFVSYFDYYQPEAYLPASDTFIEKDSSRNAEIEKFRHASTHALLTRRDTIIVASVSCIYGLGSPEIYKKANLTLEVGQNISRADLTRRLTDMQFERNDIDLARGRYRVQGDVMTIFPAYEDYQIRISQFGDEIENIKLIDPVTGDTVESVNNLDIFPARHYLAPDQETNLNVIKSIREDLVKEVEAFKQAGKLLEAQRLEQRVSYDLEMIEHTGSCSGIENYSRFFDQRPAGSPPSVLIDYFPKDFLLVIDESHMTIPQIGGMSAGDRARKDTLIQYGFRLQGARDNRPLTFEEFNQRINQTIFVSATPAAYEIGLARENSHQSGKNCISEQIIRPTGVMDPEIDIRPTEGQIRDLVAEIGVRTILNQRVLITTLTKRMAEDIAEYLQEKSIKVMYIHSDVDTMERSQILQDLRTGKYDVLVGINLLREGIDLPEVSLVAILDADKEGFLRSESALVQTIGRAARHIHGKVIMYADRITGSMQRAISETNRRRAIQVDYNAKNGIIPQSINKPIITQLPSENSENIANEKQYFKTLPKLQKVYHLEMLREQMRQAALDLDFEQAAALRDRIRDLSG